MNPKISAVCITSDKEPKEILQAALKRISWADEVILIDKSKTLKAIESPHYTLYENIPWSPIHENDRNKGLELASFDWIVMVDDDEILTPECEATFRIFVEHPTADILQIPMKQYILGKHDPEAYYWPEFRPTLHRRGSLRYHEKLHAGIEVIGSQEFLDKDHPAHIIHLSHPNISTWLEKTNRFTDFPNRAISGHFQEMNYLTAVRFLKQQYDHIDALKKWEEENLPDGNAEFLRIAREVLNA